MAIPMPEGEMLKKAIRWISDQWINDQQESTQNPSLIKLIEEAGRQFDLSPKDCDFLIHFFSGTREPSE